VPELKKSMSQKLRMNGRDYSRPGWYFVTLGADYHRHLFGVVAGGEMLPNALGRLVEKCWQEIPQHYGHIVLGAWQVMPNHFHGLVRIVRRDGAGLGEVLNLFKGSVTREARRSGAVHPAISRHGGKESGRVWAPNYYDVICFDAEELEIRGNYVRANPRRWALREVPQGRIRQSRFKGNQALLNSELKRSLRVSRRTSEAEISALQKELAAFEGLVCSTFFSPGERRCLKSLQTGSARIVWVLPMAMPASVPVDWTDAFLEDRALWLSAFPDDQTDATRESCEQANRWVARFCETHAADMDK
jgi:putative transposase